MDINYMDFYFYPARFPGPQLPPGPPRPPGGLPTPDPQQAPTSPPPAFIPAQQTATPFAVDPGAISLCLFRNTFIWLRNGSSFWYFPIFVGPRSVAGFRWNGRFGPFSVSIHDKLFRLRVFKR